jgi:signal transduction histidine kinase
MLPQFLFALILLGISASALLIAYRSLKKQLALNRMRDDFISNISHELQTPVSTVKIALEAISTYDLKKDPKVTGEYLEMASREVDRLGGLVGKVLNHALLEDQSDWLQKEACDLYEMVQKIIKTMEIAIREKGAEISLSPVAGPFMVLADPVYMEGVIINLIDNSLKYAGTNPEIEIILASGSSGVTLSVRDNGPGIPREFKDRVFEKFFRITTGNRHDVKGYGLGLNFASQVMEHHHGSISQHNLPGGGCEFILQFSAEEK